MAFFAPVGMLISVSSSFGIIAISRLVSFFGVTKNLSAATSRVPLAETSLIFAPSATSAGPRLDALTKYAGPLLPRMA